MNINDVLIFFSTFMKFSTFLGWGWGRREPFNGEGMLPDIIFLENPGVIKPLPTGNDQHLIPTLLPQKDQGICDQERDCLSNYLCLSFEKLRDPSEDVASLLHVTIDSISKHQPGTLLVYTIYWKLFFVGFLHSFHIWEGSLPSMNLFKHNFLKLCRFKFTQIMIRGGGA